MHLSLSYIGAFGIGSMIAMAWALERTMKQIANRFENRLDNWLENIAIRQERSGETLREINHYVERAVAILRQIDQRNEVQFNAQFRSGETELESILRKARGEGQP